MKLTSRFWSTPFACILLQICVFSSVAACCLAPENRDTSALCHVREIHQTNFDNNTYDQTEQEYMFGNYLRAAVQVTSSATRSFASLSSLLRSSTSIGQARSMSSSTESSSSTGPSKSNEPQTESQLSSHSSAPSTPLALPAIPSDDSTKQIDVSGQGTTVSLDHLGPIVVNQDGTMSRISNWDKMSEIEKKNTLRIIGKRNQKRLEALRAAGVQPGEVAEGST